MVDGLQVLEQMRASPQLRCVPVVMLTSSREDKDLAAAYELGANAYVVKPVGFNEFVTAIKEIGLFWAVINQAPTGTGGVVGSDP
jgi:CheY-like chemotaxis protein